MSALVANKKKALVITAIAIGSIIALFAAFSFVRSFFGSSVNILQASDYTEIGTGESTSRVTLESTVEPAKTATLYTHLTGPVSSLAVKVGDNVTTSQLLATIDTSTAERELSAQQASQAQALAQALGQAEQAQLQLDQYREQLAAGYNSGINSAQSGIRTASEAYDKAQRTFENKLRDANTGNDTNLRQQGATLATARDQLITATLDVVRQGANAGFALTGGTNNDNQTQENTNQDQAVLNSGLATADSVNRLNASVRGLNEAQTAYNESLLAIDRELAEAQQQVASAYEARREAETTAAAADFSSQQQLQSYQSAADQAWRSANTSDAAAANTINRLRLDINSSEIRAPFSGIVTDIQAEQGKPASGSLITVGDDSTIKLSAKLKESDLAKVKVGDQVSFTTPATGNQEFTGRVSLISPVAVHKPASSDSSSSSSSAKPTFPIEIEVTGNKEGLRIGSSAKTRITGESTKQPISVPTKAIYEDSGTTKVLVAETSEGNTMTIAEREVKTGAAEGTHTVITSGLKEGDRVLNNAETHRTQIGKQVFSPTVTQ
ncbi:efflux RND transporter periplasmic adaptor subunit [Corynebacterium kutscheri]|uniref:RND family efflux transporter, MFP subunit n=1 Tax=Corynebacterium kutscheri TaxID=35755 RepID=A0A0F6R0Q6_9CORY|nr:efflux RND transporter periplasmic adaptor subunit [Corynebacterium kutscheri]AKE41430.1 RND family efflux transporter, MFP subunit [Corynebacterium kutscheri]VEH08707.1 Secretion protein HlyD [Corynebacterium kutscheri]VEH09754.1 Secretion protein HlyD [Corynebacterium kutscheri]